MSHSINISQRTSKSNISTTISRKPAGNYNDIETDEMALEAFVHSLQLHQFFQLDEEEQSSRLAKIDVLDLFHALQNFTRELAMSRLENHILMDFLEKNDPKLLIGLEQRRAAAQAVNRQLSLTKTTDTGKHSVVSVVGSSISAFRSRSATSKSVLSSHTMGSQKKAAYDYKLNFRSKIDMAEKMANEVEKRVHEMEKNASHEIKLLKGRMEEMRYMELETQETLKNFELHFLRDECDLLLLNSATEKELERKLRKFVNNWIKNARALLATMHLRITNLQEHCQQLRNELITKADLSGILTAIDFEKLIIKHSELLNALEEKNNNMAGLKGVTGRASLFMTQEKQVMMNLEEESKQLNNKTMEVVKAIAKLEKEADLVEEENHVDLQILDDLRSQLERYEAPSVNEYVEKKDEVLALEKEEKMLRRKIYILNMKLDNTLKKM